MNIISKTLLVVLCASALAACGNTKGERAITGAGVGAAGGAIAGGKGLKMTPGWKNRAAQS